ncbi:hypothetical protein N7493_004449 [Penicillium malachiteum]|uniref:Uncharacterized protein n=1 Tax=Penicillium malachiteum TaxID=1324776 RepID=A0AAD6HPC6_9EURO|nr:hypothetical protein N7493_004449 [Penicillium malachiteum]
MTATATTAVTSPPALTTTFTAPTRCFTDTYFIENLSGTDYYTTTVTTGETGWWLQLGPTNWDTCFPSAYEISTDFYYSPGVCPSGYWTASQSVYSDGETRATCCPNNYNVQTRSDLDWFTTNKCTSRATTSSVWTFTKGSTISSLTTSADGINAKGVSIRWRSADFMSQTTATTTNSQLKTSATSSSRPDTSSSGLSTGAKAGIGVGATIGAILVIALGLWVWILRKKNSKNSSGSKSILDIPETHTEPAAELNATNFIVEMPSQRGPPAELGADHTARSLSPVELPTDLK